MSYKCTPEKNWMLHYQAKIFKKISCTFFTIVHSSVQSRSLPCREGLFRFNIYVKLELDVQKHSLAY